VKDHPEVEGDEFETYPSNKRKLFEVNRNQEVALVLVAAKEGAKHQFKASLFHEGSNVKWTSGERQPQWKAGMHFTHPWQEPRKPV